MIYVFSLYIEFASETQFLVSVEGDLIGRSCLLVGWSVSVICFFLTFQKERYLDLGGWSNFSEDSELVNTFVVV